MTYLEKKRSLGIPPTLIDTGFEPFGFSKYEQSDYLPGKVYDRRKFRPAIGEDLTHLNPPETLIHQKVGRLGGRKARK